MAKVLVGTPIFNFQNLNLRENQKFVRETSIHEVDYIELVGMNIEQAKQVIYKKMLEGDWDYCMIVDSDILFLPDEINPIDRLVEADKDVVGGFYVSRKIPCVPIYRPLDLQEMYERDGKFPETYKFVVPDDIFEVAGCPGGCMMIKREVIERLTTVYTIPNLPMIHKGEYLSEDYSFCKRARDEGYKIYILPQIKLGHLGEYLYTIKDYK